MLDVAFRSVAIATKDDGSKRAVIATENPVSMPDNRRKSGEILETLLMSGAEASEDRSMPLYDEHNYDSVRSIFGRINNVTVENGQLVGDVSVSDSEPEIKGKVNDGTIRHLSVGYMIKEMTIVPTGESRNIGGRVFAGPHRVVTKWQPLEGSLTGIPRDRAAKFRSHLLNSCVTTFQNSPRGSMTDETKISETPEANVVETRSESEVNPVTRTVEDSSVRNDVDTLRKSVDDLVAAQKRSQVESEIRKEAERLGLRSHADELAQCGDMATAYRKALDILASNQKSPAPITFGRSHQEKETAALEHGFMRRCMGAAGFANAVKDPAIGHEDFANVSLIEVARRCLLNDGIDCSTWAHSEIAKRALGFACRHSAPQAYHTTGSFSNLTSNVMNKVLLQQYVLTPTTWQTVGKQGASVRDFKPFYRMRLSEARFLDNWEDNTVPNQIKLSDKKESKGVEARSDIVSISYQTLINDDLNALSRVPQQLGAAAAATVDYVFWKTVADNPTQADGNAYFSSAHGNNIAQGSGATPSTASLNTMRSKMRTMKGMNSDMLLAAIPKYLVGPAALETVITQLCTSQYDITATTSTNVYTPNTFRGLVPVVVPYLDAFSTGAYYMFGDTSFLTSFEVTFLEGQEQPIIRTWLEEATLAQKVQVIQSFTVLPVDPQAAVFNYGS